MATTWKQMHGQEKTPNSHTIHHSPQMAISKDLWRMRSRRARSRMSFSLERIKLKLRSDQEHPEKLTKMKNKSEEMNNNDYESYLTVQIPKLRFNKIKGLLKFIRNNKSCFFLKICHKICIVNENLQKWSLQWQVLINTF